MNFQFQIADTLIKTSLELAKSAAGYDMEELENNIKGSQDRDQGSVRKQTSILRNLLDRIRTSYRGRGKGRGRVIWCF